MSGKYIRSSREDVHFDPEVYIPRAKELRMQFPHWTKKQIAERMGLKYHTLETMLKKRSVVLDQRQEV